MTRDLARKLRSELTDAERLLWRHLREFKREGLHFRRQVPIGPYVADFACHSAKLIVELDGSQHGEKTNVARDTERTAFLESEGYRVLRIWNGELLADPQMMRNSSWCKQERDCLRN
jgi:very-short-patch-repair endonuclease